MSGDSFKTSQKRNTERNIPVGFHMNEQEGNRLKGKPLV